jgi:hypothetical protein
MGDAHRERGAQGDSEFDGTGIETSITGRFRIKLHEKLSLPLAKIVQVSAAACLSAFQATPVKPPGVLAASTCGTHCPSRLCQSRTRAHHMNE